MELLGLEILDLLVTLVSVGMRDLEEIAEILGVLEIQVNLALAVTPGPAVTVVIGELVELRAREDVMVDLVSQALEEILEQVMEVLEIQHIFMVLVRMVVLVVKVAVVVLVVVMVVMVEGVDMVIGDVVVAAAVPAAVAAAVIMAVPVAVVVMVILVLAETPEPTETLENLLEMLELGTPEPGDLMETQILEDLAQQELLV